MARSACLSEDVAAARSALCDTCEIAAHPHKHVDERGSFVIGEARIGLIKDFVASLPHLIEQAAPCR